MGILNKRAIRNALENPLAFIIIFLLVIVALANSFAIGCLISSVVGVVLELITLNKINANSIINFFCDNSSWKLKGVDILSDLLGKHIILIMIIGFICWGLLNHTERGRRILSLLD